MRCLNNWEHIVDVLVLPCERERGRLCFWRQLLRNASLGGVDHCEIVDILPPHVIKDCADAGTSAEALTNRTSRHTVDKRGSRTWEEEPIADVNGTDVIGFQVL